MSPARRSGRGDALPPDLSTDRAAALAANPVSRETLARLDRFVDVLLTWQRTVNLIGPSTLARLWTRHVGDSLQILPFAPDARVWVDFGSGAGFPGLVLACVLADVSGAVVHLVESNAKKAAFLREAARTVAAPAVVHHARIEHFVAAADERFDVVTARALAPMVKLLALSEPLLKRGAQAVFLKGQDVEAELTQASKCWNIEAALTLSGTDPRGRIVTVRRVERRHLVG